MRNPHPGESLSQAHLKEHVHCKWPHSYMKNVHCEIAGNVRLRWH